MMILSLIVNILALIGVLTLALIALALWAFASDEEFHEYEGLSSSIPTLQPLSPPTMRDAEICEKEDTQ